nr:hypothetical protein [Desulfoscipio geothermicus]
MKLRSCDTPFDSADHVFEVKWDGIRCVMHFSKNQVRLQSRTGRDCTSRFPELWSPELSADEAVLDGELVVLTGGKPDFYAVMERYHAGQRRTRVIVNTLPAQYVVWDILRVNGRDVTRLPLAERKELLVKTITTRNQIIPADWVDGEGVALFNAVKQWELEGIVAKRKDGKYLPGKYGDWLKIKNYRYASLDVMGISKKNGSVLVGHEGKVLARAMGITAESRDVLRKLHVVHETKDARFFASGYIARVKYTVGPRGIRDCVWVGFDR